MSFCSNGSAEYSHSEMVDKTQPTTGMFEEYVEALLKSLAPLMMEHVLGLEGLIDRQIDRVIRIGHAGLIRTRRFFLGASNLIINDVLLALFATVFPFHGRRHPLMMRLAEAR